MFRGLREKLILLILLSMSKAFGADPEAIAGEYVVQLKKNVSKKTALLTLNKGMSVKVKRVIPNSDIVVLKINDNKNQKQTVSRLLQSDVVQIAEPNYIYRTSRLPNDPEIGKLWGLVNSGQADSNKSIGIAGVDIGAEKAWDIQTGNQDLLISVIDTGVDYNHKDLKGNIWTNEAEANGTPGVDDDNNGYVDDIHGYDFVNKDGDPMDDHGHGSHCSGTIAAKGDDNQGIVGVAWNAKIMGVKFLSKDGSGSLDDAVEAIKYSTKMGVKIMSNSWGGGGYSEIMKEAIDEANAKGIVFTAAAGNHSGNNDESPSYPASYNVPNVISVAAVDNRGRLATFSCFGRRTVHVAAPGVNVFSSLPGGYASWSGTSMATPHVSGVVALLLSQDPTLTPEKVRERLIKTSKPLAGLKGKSASNGIVDAYMALTNQMAPPDPNDPANWPNTQALSISTPHPYSEKYTDTWTVEIPGAKDIALFFDKFDTEARYDKLVLFDRSGKKIGEMTGDLGEAVWSPVVSGDFVQIKFTADDSVNDYGFELTKVAHR
ncbi:MAG: hypothetical protein RJB66_2348 [Pseudomonadota bacterium]|jgi:subtilisin family serine protease